MVSGWKSLDLLPATPRTSPATIEQYLGPKKKCNFPSSAYLRRVPLVGLGSKPTQKDLQQARGQCFPQITQEEWINSKQAEWLGLGRGNYFKGI